MARLQYTPYKRTQKQNNFSGLDSSGQMEVPVIVEYVRYRSDNGFAILSCWLDFDSPKCTKDVEQHVHARFGESNFVVSLNSLDYNENPTGGQYVFVGEFMTHNKYGDQFKADFYYQVKPSTVDGLISFLMKLPHVKEARSKAIVDKFGLEGTIEVLDNDFMRLTEINGITPDRAKMIKKVWDDESAMRELYAWLSEHGISPKLGMKIFDTWKTNSIAILEENPYRLTEIRGIGFLTADAIAHKVLKEIKMEDRVKACIMYVLAEDLRANGNLCSAYDYVRAEVVKTIEACDQKEGRDFDMKAYLKLIPQCIRDNLHQFTAIKNPESDNGGSYVYLKPIWEKERFIADRLYHRGKKDSIWDCTEEDLSSAQDDVCDFSNRMIVLDECQRDAIRSAFSKKITVITGGGGTGKSTICRCICYLAQKKGLATRLMSPTGKAAQVLADKTGHEAATIHRSLCMKPEDNHPNVHILEDLTIVDEISMVGIDTLYAIMLAIEGNITGNLVLVGDANQLPSVSPGNFLADIMRSKCAEVVKLDKIHRQDEKSYIPVLASQIANGKVVDVPDDATDISWHDAYPDIVEDKVVGAIQNYLATGGEIKDIQVMSPMYKGTCGVDRINEALQTVMSIRNGSENEFIERPFKKYYIGDRVIQLENNYDKMVFNGDIGYVTNVGRMAPSSNDDRPQDFVSVDFYGEEHIYWADEIDQIRLAWCITVHKYQGSQIPNVIFVMSSEARRMFSKELLYTALTRAENRVDVYGSRDMFRLAPTRSVVKRRFTHLDVMIKEFRESRKILTVME